MRSRDLPPVDRRLVEVWLAMAEHFLDTETRQLIPLTALRCAEAELSPERARHVWQHEVSPALGHNLLDVAGEWAGWPEDWLVERIEGIRARNGSLLGAAVGLVRPLLLRGVWDAIERCLAFLLDAPPSEREPLARALLFLSRHAFDFVPQPLDAESPETQERICALYPDPILHILGPALIDDEERRAVEERLRATLP